MSNQSYDIGTVYVLSNIDGSLAKAGLTRSGTPDGRATQYERDHGIRWHVYWFATTTNVGAVEARIHRELAPYRFALVPGATEVYHLVPGKAVAVAERFVIPPPGASPTARAPHAADGAGSWREWAKAAALAAIIIGLDRRAFPRVVRGTARRVVLHLFRSR